MPAFPFDVTNLLGGAVRILFADLSQTTPPPVPTGPKDVFAQIDPYAAATGWTDFGATRDASSYERTFASTAWDIQQSQAAVVEQVTQNTRRLTVSAAEVRPDVLSIFEQSEPVATIAAATGQGAQKAVGMGQVSTLKRYRIAFVAMRDLSAGVVNETAGGTQRGRFVVGVGYSAAIVADTAAIEANKGAQSAMPLTFNFYPVAGQPDDQAFGRWYLEDAGTLT